MEDDFKFQQLLRKCSEIIKFNKRQNQSNNVFVHKKYKKQINTKIKSICKY